MPIYEYHCNECSKDFECLVLGSDDAADCPECSSKNVSRIMSACGFFSKGRNGLTESSSAGSSCSGCTSTNCGSCGH